jgi:excisionase family DNA binding protein
MSLAEALRAEIRLIVREELAGMSSPQPAVRLLSVEEAAEALGIGRTAAYEAIRRGQVRSVKLGRRRLIANDALIEFANRNTINGAGA